MWQIAAWVPDRVWVGEWGFVVKRSTRKVVRTSMRSIAIAIALIAFFVLLLLVLPKP